MIYVTVGTMFMDFPRLILKMDEVARDTGERVVIQTGMGATVPVHSEYFDFRAHDEVLALQREARVIVCHAGIGCVLDALAVRRPLIVVPRRRQYQEHMTDHQLDVAEAVERRGWGRMVLDVAELPTLCAEPPPVPESYRPAKAELVAAVRGVVERVAAARGPRR